MPSSTPNYARSARVSFVWFVIFLLIFLAAAVDKSWVGMIFFGLLTVATGYRAFNLRRLMKAGGGEYISLTQRLPLLGVAARAATVTSAGCAGLIITGVVGLAVLGGTAAGLNGTAESPLRDLQPLPTTHLTGEKNSANKILVIPIHGLILGQPSGVLGSFNLDNLTYGYAVQEKLKEAAKDDSIKAIVMDIDSPGGTIFGSQAIVDGVDLYKKITKKPVVAWVSGMGASGAYWAAVAADSVWADHGTGVGSIGIISGPYKFYDGVQAEDGGLFAGGVVTERGIETTYITAGKSKDLGNPYRRLTAEELKQLQQSIDREYDGFVTHVSARRGLEQGTVRNQIGAMLFTPGEATDNGLIDGVASRDQVLAKAAAAAKISSDWQAVSLPQESSPWSWLTGLVKQPTPSAAACEIRGQTLALHGDLASFCAE